MHKICIPWSCVVVAYCSRARYFQGTSVQVIRVHVSFMKLMRKHCKPFVKFFIGHKTLWCVCWRFDLGVCHRIDSVFAGVSMLIIISPRVPGVAFKRFQDSWSFVAQTLLNLNALWMEAICSIVEASLFFIIVTHIYAPAVVSLACYGLKCCNCFAHQFAIV